MRKLRLVVPLLVSAVGAGCPRTTPPVARDGEPPQVDIARVRAGVQGTWIMSQANDMSTITWTWEIRAAEVVRSETWAQISMPARTEAKGVVPYRITEHGAIAFSPRDGVEEVFTAVVAEGEICAALTDWPCRVLGWDGFLAQSPLVYRREHASVRKDGEQVRKSGFVSTVRFARPPAELVAPGAPPCALALEISAHGGRSPVTRRFDLSCDATPAARGRLARIAVRGFDTSRGGGSSVWSNHVWAHRLIDTDDSETVAAFGRAFQPVLYFDPADPWLLHFEYPSGYRATP